MPPREARWSPRAPEPEAERLEPESLFARLRKSHLSLEKLRTAAPYFGRTADRPVATRRAPLATLAAARAGVRVPRPPREAGPSEPRRTTPEALASGIRR